MKTEILRFFVCICFAMLLVHVTVTPFIITRTVNQPSAQVECVDFYETHYAKGDSIDYNLQDSINLSNSKIYEEE